MTLTILCKKYDIRSGSIEIGFDGQQALKAASNDWPLKIDQPDFDLLKDTRAKCAALPILTTWHWICGHQDNNDDYQNLDQWARNNIQADTLAKMLWNHCEQVGIQLPNQVLGDKGWSFRFNGKKQSRLKKHSLY